MASTKVTAAVIQEGGGGNYSECVLRDAGLSRLGKSILMPDNFVAVDLADSVSNRIKSRRSLIISFFPAQAFNRKGSMQNHRQCCVTNQETERDKIDADLVV